jgi:MFS family permease
MPPAVAQLASFSTFAVGFIARPVGGVIFGHFGDRFGRKRALVAALLLMGLASTFVGLLPSYGAIGAVAPVALTLLRFCQGLAVGGQWGGAALLAVESAPEGKRGFFGSFTQLGVPVGLVAGNLIFLLMTDAVSPAAFEAWGWRVPFLFSVVLVGLSVYVQTRLEETPEFQALEEAEGRVEAQAKAARSRSPILDAIKKHPKEILLAAGSFVAPNGCFYLIITYVVAYATKNLGMERPVVLQAVLWGAVITAGLTPISGILSDRFGRRGIFLAGALLTGLWAFAFWRLVDTGGFLPLLIAISGGLAFQTFMYGPQAALFAELFSPEVRYSGASMGYQLGAILGGGFAPMIASALLAEYQSSMAIAAYWAVLCTIAFISVLLLSETNKRAHKKA